MESVHDNCVGIREIFSKPCADIIGVEIFLIIASDDEHMIARSAIGEVAVSEFLSGKRSDDRMTLRQFILYLFDSWIIDDLGFEGSAVVFCIELSGLCDGRIDSASKHLFLNSGHREDFFLELGQ